MTPRHFAAECQRLLAGKVRSIVLYGSAAAADHIPGESDFNLLVLLSELGMAELEVLAPLARAWSRQGNRPPLLFTSEAFARAADTFPIEWSDVLQSREVLAGEDLSAPRGVDPEMLRLGLEREFQAKLLHLRECYMLAAGDGRRIVELMLDSLTSFLVLARAALRLFEANPPAEKLVAAERLSRYIGFQPEVFATLFDVKRGRSVGRGLRAKETFAAYLGTLKTIAAAIDRHVTQPKSGES